MPLEIFNFCIFWDFSTISKEAYLSQNPQPKYLSFENNLWNMTYYDIDNYTWQNQFLGGFKKPAVCKYPITVIKSETYILLPKPYSLMWHLVRRNHGRNGRDRRPQTCWMRSPKGALLKLSMDSVESMMTRMMTRMMSTAFGIGVAETTCRVGVLHADSMNMYMSALPGRVVILQRSAYSIGFLKNASFIVNEVCLFRAFYHCHFLHDFYTWGVTFNGKALATKCIFQNYSQLLDYTRLVLKTAEELILPSVYSLHSKVWATTFVQPTNLICTSKRFGRYNYNFEFMSLKFKSSFKDWTSVQKIRPFKASL